MFKEENAVEKFTFYNTKEVINKILPDDQIKTFWKEFLELSDYHYNLPVEQATEPPSDEWKQLFESENYVDTRLDFIQNYLTRYQTLLCHLPPSSKSDKHNSLPNIKSRLTNEKENWKCPCCNSKHISLTSGRNMPYLRVCTKFNVL